MRHCCLLFVVAVVVVLVVAVVVELWVVVVSVGDWWLWGLVLPMWVGARRSVIILMVGEGLRVVSWGLVGGFISPHVNFPTCAAVVIYLLNNPSTYAPNWRSGLGVVCQ